MQNEMANEELLRQLPHDIERVDEPGPFFVRKYLGSYSVVTLSMELVTSSGPEAKERATQLANALNAVWNAWPNQDLTETEEEQ